ncbi:hypothetical protein AVEN_101952-1 [Araneus ventricosus]|uniref:Uncharacterized protein n=1 Tax=Araneus ventricosus TaxID=182803 RepID=A0A4Y2K7V8_ARAVE|nr:hypothetical protein AVEN_101952-1 [Araneus ventricosus]
MVKEHESGEGGYGFYPVAVFLTNIIRKLVNQYLLAKQLLAGSFYLSEKQRRISFLENPPKKGTYHKNGANSGLYLKFFLGGPRSLSQAEDVIFFPSSWALATWTCYMYWSKPD